MNLVDPWNAIFLVGFVAYLWIRGVYATRTKSNEKVLLRGDAADKGLMFIVFIGSLFLPLLYLITPWLGLADYESPVAVRACGAGVMVFALWLFWRSHADLGRNWSITLELRKDHELITHGVYRAIRHPMYAAIFLFSLAQALLLPNWLAGPAAFVTFLPLYFRRLPREEQMMREAFAEQYRVYSLRTGRLVPRLIVRQSD